MANINISDLRPADSASYLNDLTEEEILYVEGGFFWFAPVVAAAVTGAGKLGAAIWGAATAANIATGIVGGASSAVGGWAVKKILP